MSYWCITPVELVMYDICRLTHHLLDRVLWQVALRKDVWESEAFNLKL
jgi:hypothetical protein